MDGITLGTLGIGSGWAIVALGVIYILRGGLVPRRTYEDALHDRDEWRAAHRISETARVISAEQVDKLVASAQVTEAFLRALPRADVRETP